MSNAITQSNWLSQFPGLKSIDPSITQHLVKSSAIVEVKKDTRIFGPGQAPESFLLLISGTVRVQQVSESGREIVLYRVSAGESCALTTACLMGYDEYLAEGIAETDIVAVSIPRATFDELIATSVEFRRFVFTAFSVRITSLFRIIDEVAFARIDVRLAGCLLDRQTQGDALTITHQQLASELGTAREVISRQLHEFQRRGWIKTGRGTIEILDHTALQTLSGDN